MNIGFYFTPRIKHIWRYNVSKYFKLLRTNLTFDDPEEHTALWPTDRFAAVRMLFKFEQELL